MGREWSTDSASRQPRSSANQQAAECSCLDHGYRFVRLWRAIRVGMVPGMAASLRPRALLARRNGQSAAGPDVHIWEPVHAERLIDLADVIRVMRQETHEDTLTRMNLNLPV